MGNPQADYLFDTDACDDARASAMPLPIAALVLGGLVLAGAWVTAGVTRQSQGPGQMPVERYFLGRKLGRQDEPKEPQG
jgi:hypothetical protein